MATKNDTNEPPKSTGPERSLVECNQAGQPIIKHQNEVEVQMFEVGLVIDEARCVHTDLQQEADGLV